MSDPVAISRLLDEIRGDTRWRDELAALAARGGFAPGGAEAVERLSAAIAEAASEVAIEAGSPIVGDAMARLRRRVHAEIRIYQDRQTAVNLEVADAVRRIETRLAALEEAVDGLFRELRTR